MCWRCGERSRRGIPDYYEIGNNLTFLAAVTIYRYLGYSVAAAGCISSAVPGIGVTERTYIYVACAAVVNRYILSSCTVASRCIGVMLGGVGRGCISTAIPGVGIAGCHIHA